MPLKVLHPDQLQAARRLKLRLSRRVDSIFVGEYRSAFRGSGLEFEDVRPYSPGDDVRRMDWKLTARERQPYVKVFRESRELTLILVLDVSASMKAGGSDRLALQLAGALAVSAIQNGDRVGLLRFSDRVEGWLPPAKGRQHLLTLFSALHDVSPALSKGSRLEAATRAIGQHVSRQATICVLSDFLFPIDSSWSVLCRRHSVHGLLLHDDMAEKNLEGGLIDVVDAETGATQLIDLAHCFPSRQLAEKLLTLRQKGGITSQVSTSADPILALRRHFVRSGRSR